MTFVRGVRSMTAALCSAVTATSMLAGAGRADDELKGKVITIYVGFMPGGSYDYFGRIAGRYLGKYLPGHPGVVVQNMPGAGSLRAANFLYAAAPKDGTALGVITQTLPLEEALDNPGAHYKSAEFNWIGRLSAVMQVYFTWKTSRARTIADAKQYPAAMAGTGSGSPSEGYPKLFNGLAGTKFKIVSGYTGSGEGMLAMERGEVDGGLTSWNTILLTKKDWVANNDLNILAQFVAQRDARLPDVPTALEVVDEGLPRQVFGFYLGGEELGRALVAPPGVSTERVAILRQGFDAMVKDPELIAEIEKSGQEFRPANGALVQKLVADVAAAPPEVKKRTQTLLSAK
jgi:tripartite-type tricarboxylate transporter receptor subunit TctC